MFQAQMLIAIAVALALLVAPLLLGLRGLLATRRAPPGAEGGPAAPWNWRLTITSARLYALAFNLIFFTQELFLVLPKALTPGLHPILFHNNHTWAGDNPLANLLQGTGALAILATGVGCVLILRRMRTSSATVRLLLVWVAYNGFFQSLPQVVIGAVEPQNDVGMAMDYLGLGTGAKLVAAFAALAVMPAVALWLRRPLLSLAADPADIADSGARSRFVFRVATLPALAAILLIVPFRVPRGLIEVVAVPVVVTVVGIAWLQAGAWRASAVKAEGAPGPVPISYPLAALLILLLVFQLLLRPGIRFY
jgi:hypothetical protein